MSPHLTVFWVSQLNGAGINHWNGLKRLLNLILAFPTRVCLRMTVWTPHTLNTFNPPPTTATAAPSLPISALRQPGNQRACWGSWHSIVSTSITNVINPGEGESLALVSVFLISTSGLTSGGQGRRTPERQGQQFVHMCLLVWVQGYVSILLNSTLRPPLNILSPSALLSCCSSVSDSVPFAKP